MAQCAKYHGIIPFHGTYDQKNHFVSERKEEKYCDSTMATP